MKITEEVIKDFRRFLPAFSDTTKWGADAIMLQLVEADAMTGGSCWAAFDIDDDRNLKSAECIILPLTTWFRSGATLARLIRRRSSLMRV